VQARISNGGFYVWWVELFGGLQVYFIKCGAFKRTSFYFENYVAPMEFGDMFLYLL
jgi:hypothetical protein